MALSHDDRYRLRSVKDAVATTTFSVDDMGRVVEVSSEHAEAWLNVRNVYGEQTTAASRLTSHGAEKLVYDEAGRLVKDGSRQLVWDAKGRLAEVRHGDTVER